MEYIRFFFEDFWHWLGLAMLLYIVVYGIFGNISEAFSDYLRRNKKPSGHTTTELPTEAPDGAIWPYEGKYYIRLRGVWVDMTGFTQEEDGEILL